LAFHLKIPVYKIENEMPASELRNWARYLEARPIGWREDQRAAYTLNALGVKASPSEVFSSLAQLKKWDDEREESEKMQDSLARSMFGAMLERANKKE
jgi:hypothetical protein